MSTDMAREHYAQRSRVGREPELDSMFNRWLDDQQVELERKKNVILRDHPFEGGPHDTGCLHRGPANVGGVVITENVFCGYPRLWHPEPVPEQPADQDSVLMIVEESHMEGDVRVIDRATIQSTSATLDDVWGSQVRVVKKQDE